MTDTSSYVVPAGLLGALGALWGGTPTAVSPLSFGPGAPLTDAERAALTEAGVLDASGALTSGVRPVLDALGSADAFTRVYLSGGLAPYEYLVCFGANGATASLINAGGEMSMSAPALSDVFVGMIGESLGGSSFVGAPLEATIGPAAALVLGALIDVQRRASLEAVLAGGDPEVVALPETAVAKLVAKARDDREWLANVLFEMLGSSGLSADDVGPALEVLESAGAVAKSASGYTLTGAALLLGQRLLVLDGALVLSAGAVSPSGEVSVAGFTVLQAGVHDLLSIDVRETEVELRGVSAAEVSAYAEAFLTDGTVVRRLQAAAGPVAGATPKPAPTYCAKCGAKLTPGASFCVKCGARVG